MKIVADTNVLISSTFWEGASNKIIQKVENCEIELFLSEEIINEFKEALDYEEIKEKIKEKNLEMKRSVEKIISVSSIVAPSKKLLVCTDPKDNKILECALEAVAEFIITYDNHLLRLNPFESINILTPEEFLKIIK